MLIQCLKKKKKVLSKSNIFVTKWIDKNNFFREKDTMESDTINFNFTRGELISWGERGKSAEEIIDQR